MIIDKDGYTLDTLDDLLTAFELFLKSKYGEDFYIKAEGVIDNIVSSVSFQIMSLQEQLAYLMKQFDTESAEGQFQDALYERLLCYRIKAEKTVVERTINGTAGLLVKAGTVTIRNKATLDEFINKDDVTIDDNGSVVADFECVLFGAIDLPQNAEIEVISLPIGVNTVTTGDNPKIDIGRDRETDEEYKVRFRNEKTQNAKATRHANLINLGKYVDDESYLNIVDKKNDDSMNCGEVKIIVNHNTTDTIFANAIFNTVADGIDTIGTTTHVVKDDANQDVTINWINASFTEVALKMNIKIKTGYLFTQVANDIKSAIINYVDKRIYGLGATVYANEFIIPIFGVDGVENVSNIQVGVNGSENFAESLEIDSTALAMFNVDWITINELS